MDDEYDYAEFANNHSIFDDILVMGKKKKMIKQTTWKPKPNQNYELRYTEQTTGAGATPTYASNRQSGNGKESAVLHFDIGSPEGKVEHFRIASELKPQDEGPDMK